MGCVVNGPGEARMADLALCGGKNCFALFRKGAHIATLPVNEAITTLLKLVAELA